MIIILTGRGKGKTSAAMGTALRAIYNKRKVIIIQFLKTDSSSEIKLFRKFQTMKQPACVPSTSAGRCDNVTIKSFGKKTLTNPKELTKKDFDLITKSLKFVEKSISQKPFLIILDEILVALKFKLIKESEILKIIKQCKKENIHLILTGRGATKELIKKADLVTEMRKIKHPFDEGVEAIKGLDY
jgi:cob(I)alamin adenosyltransferase